MDPQGFGGRSDRAGLFIVRCETERPQTVTNTPTGSEQEKSLLAL